VLPSGSDLLECVWDTLGTSFIGDLLIYAHNFQFWAEQEAKMLTDSDDVSPWLPDGAPCTGTQQPAPANGHCLQRVYMGTCMFSQQQGQYKPLVQPATQQNNALLLYY
jgi:hypothetical protein